VRAVAGALTARARFEAARRTSWAAPLSGTVSIGTDLADPNDHIGLDNGPIPIIKDDVTEAIARAEHEVRQAAVGQPGHLGARRHNLGASVLSGESDLQLGPGPGNTNRAPCHARRG